MGLYDLRNIKTAPLTHTGHFWEYIFVNFVLDEVSHKILN